MAGDTSEEFLKSLAESLRSEENIDLGMADILVNHIIKVAPTLDAIDQAKDAILKLASERAQSAELEVTNG
jgi:hypothetical protein